MVISAEPPPDSVADAAVAAAAAVAARSTAGQDAFSSFPSIKMWGSNRALLCAHVSRGGDAIATATARRPTEKPLRHHDEVEAAGSDAPTANADTDHAEPVEAPEPAAPSPSRLRARRRRRQREAVAPLTSASPPAERRPSRAAVRGEPSHRARFSVTLTAEEINEDIYAVTGARARRHPRRRPRPVQKQLDMLFPGSWLSEITAEIYRVPDGR